MRACAFKRGVESVHLAGEVGAARFVGEEESVTFSVAETVERVNHELTEKEAAEEEKWRLKQEQRRQLGFSS